MPTATANGADPHAILGVRKNASQKTICRAYRKLAMENHLDRNVGDEQAAARFKAVHEAYAKLTGKQTKPDNSANQSFEIISQVFATVVVEQLKKDIDPLTVNLVDVMRRQLQDIISYNRQELGGLDKARANMEAVSDRFEGKESESMRGIVAFHIANIIRQAEMVRAKISCLEKALKVLDDLSFRSDGELTAAIRRVVAGQGPQYMRFAWS